ncbi:hypothetical protein BpHYR1_051405 [Brachionus plicatilis]|uniref:Uncharacterized protein n=1 Tax=Brachionus plicatilis TaxID=10195 RepID=A0A3M7S203_BRAPC|nr:hypothetical protein BpHYR1_051405 [Brachionus plicatilis]
MFICFDQQSLIRIFLIYSQLALKDEDIIGNIEAKNIDTSTDDIDDELVETITEPESITLKDAIEMISKLLINLIAKALCNKVCFTKNEEFLFNLKIYFNSRKN